MKLLVLGGTRFLSESVAVQAIARGHDVTVAARGESGEPPKSARFVKIDREKPETFAALDGESFDAVVDISRLPGHVGPALDALADRVGHWTFVSTISVYPDNSAPGLAVADTALREPTAPDSVATEIEQYGASKVACENLVRERLGDKAFIVRPGLIVGPGDPGYRFGYWPDRISEGGEILAPGAPDDHVQWIDVRDQAAWILDAAETGLTGTFDAICPPVTRERFLTDIAKAFNVEPSFTWVPQDVLLDNGVKEWAGEQSLPLWVRVPEYGGLMDRDMSASVAAGMKIRPVGESALDWFESEKGNPRKPGLGLSRDKEAEVLAIWQDTSR